MQLLLKTLNSLNKAKTKELISKTLNNNSCRRRDKTNEKKSKLMSIVSPHRACNTRGY